MASKINYNNKAPFQTLEEIPDENKVNASDMNEIKTVVNNNADELDTAKENIESLQNGQGTSNADITNLKNRVSTLETDNSTNKTDISSLKTEQEEQNNRLNILEEDNTTNKQDISSIKSEQTEQDKQIDILLNALPAETQEAENINLKGTIPVKFKEFKVSGNSKQETSDTMPSPEFPSEIQNVEGDVNVTVVNKNLFTDFIKGKGLFSSTGEEKVDDKSGTSNFIQVNFDKNESYCLSGLTDTINSFVAFYNKNKDYLGRTAGSLKTSISFNSNSYASMAQNYEFIKDKNIRFIRVTQYEIDTSIGTIDDIDNLQVQLETGSTSTAYVPHKQQTVTFPLSEGQKLYKGDYLADDGIHHVRKQIELNGTENWLQFPEANQFYITLKDSKAKNNEISIMSSHYKGIPFLNRGSNSDKECAISESKTLAIFTKDYTTVSDFKSYLAKQKANSTPVIVEYELAEEEIEAYTEEQQEAYNQLKQLTAYDEETNVYSTNEVSPVFSITAVKDINSVITQLNTVLLERS